MTNLKYHNKSLELIGSQPKFSGETYPNLPASVAEWYSLINGVELLEQYSNTDFPLPPSEFKTYVHEDKELIVFMYDNAGLLWYAFENCKDDPQTYVNIEPPPNNWVKDSKSFSEFIYTWIFDHQYYYHKKDFIITKQGEVVQKDDLEILFTEFIKEPVSYIGGPYVYRFSLNEQRIIIFNYDKVSSWVFSADTQTSLNDVYGKFKHLFE